jgi:hypothetical protein
MHVENHQLRKHTVIVTPPVALLKGRLIMTHFHCTTDSVAKKLAH